MPGQKNIEAFSGKRGKEGDTPHLKKKKMSEVPQKEERGGGIRLFSEEGGGGFSFPLKGGGIS